MNWLGPPARGGRLPGRRTHERHLRVEATLVMAIACKGDRSQERLPVGATPIEATFVEVLPAGTTPARRGGCPRVVVAARWQRQLPSV
ncbi:hypothetical protein BHM03_00033156 [Ensete ventricosum]|nr:hypothetical protein BHM03_00033156 [Ensete ventricosum]